MNTQTQHNCQCHCDATRFTVRVKPIIRGFCHCTICQAFNHAPYADITVFRARDVDLPEDNKVAFQAYRSPPVLQRGKCAACDRPAIEFLRIPLMPRLAIVPSVNIGDKALVPEPSLHIFYDRRVAEVEDQLPKYAGYAKSQLAFGGRIMTAMLRR